MSQTPILYVVDPNWFFCTQIEANSVNECDFAILATEMSSEGG
jgi:hypothetical protein